MLACLAITCYDTAINVTCFCHIHTSAMANRQLNERHASSACSEELRLQRCCKLHLESLLAHRQVEPVQGRVDPTVDPAVNTRVHERLDGSVGQAGAVGGVGGGAGGVGRGVWLVGGRL